MKNQHKKTSGLEKIISFSGVFFILMFITISGYPKNQESMKKTYEVYPLENKLTIDANWNKEVWKSTPGIILENYMGDRPDHFPKTEMKMRYDSDNIYVIFRVEDKYVKALATETHGRVWEDSCVEFFFTPGSETEEGYFNLETNCIGTFLMQYHNRIANDDGFIDLKYCKDIVIKSSITENMEEEVEGPLIWTLEYKLPIYFLKNYLSFKRPGPGVTWRANFYKCGDKTSHPHWITWSLVDFPKPKFHLPEFFGYLEFK